MFNNSKLEQQVTLQSQESNLRQPNWSQLQSHSQSIMYAEKGLLIPTSSPQQDNQSPRERERENYAEKGGNPFLHMLREWTLT